MRYTWFWRGYSLLIFVPNDESIIEPIILKAWCYPCSIEWTTAESFEGGEHQKEETQKKLIRRGCLSCQENAGADACCACRGCSRGHNALWTQGSRNDFLSSKEDYFYHKLSYDWATWFQFFFHEKLRLELSWSWTTMSWLSKLTFYIVSSHFYDKISNYHSMLRGLWIKLENRTFAR